MERRCKSASERGQDRAGRVTTADDLPQKQNSVVPGEETAPNNSKQPQTHIFVKNPVLCSVLSGQSGSCLYQWVGTERLWEHDREGGWMGGGGGAKGEPWLMKWLRFSKPWPAPCSLPNNPVTAGPSHKASIVLLACHSPHQTYNTHTLLLLISIPAKRTRNSPTSMRWNKMKWNEMRAGGGYPFNFLFIPSLLLVPPENSPTSQTSIVQKFKGGKQEKNEPEPVALVCFDGWRCIMRDDTSMCKVFRLICLRGTKLKQSNEENTTSSDRRSCTDVKFSQLFRQALSW